MAENEPFGSGSFNNQINDVRKELDAKIDQKISEKVFWSVIGAAVIISIAVVTGTIKCVFEQSDKANEMDKRLSILENKIKEQIVPQLNQANEQIRINEGNDRKIRK